MTASGESYGGDDGAIMRNKSKLPSCGLSLAILFLLICAGATTRAQETQKPLATTQTQAPTNQTPDLGPLNLTPDQIQRIRAINAELKEQRQAAVQRLRQAQRALTEAVESPTPSEALIDQRSREVAEAQAGTIRIRSLTEARILQVLTPEQRIRLREMRQRNQALRRDGNQQFPRNGANRRRDGAQGNNNTLGPLRQRRLLRQQRQP
jgi:Spy/CpxP family protein refolding chaperone